MSIKSLHQTKPFVTHRACARCAPNSFAGETNVRYTKGFYDAFLLHDSVRGVFACLGDLRFSWAATRYGQ
jgi:hypothetical protein